MASIGRKFDDIPDIGKEWVSADPIIKRIEKMWYPFEKIVPEVKVIPNAAMQIDWPYALRNVLTFVISAHGTNSRLDCASAAIYRGLHAGDILYSKDNSSGDDEWAIIDTIDRTNHYVYAYNVSGTEHVDSAGDYASGDRFYVVGNAQGEAGRAGVVQYDYDVLYNYLQSFAVEITRSDFNKITNTRVEDNQFQNQQALREYLKRIELAMILGNRDSSAGVGSNEASDGKIFLTGGMKYWIDAASQNKTIAKVNFTGADGMKLWTDALLDILEYGGNKTHWCVCGREFYYELYQLYTSKNIEFTPVGPKDFDLFDVRTFLGKNLHITVHPGLTNDFAYTAFFLDSSEVQMGLGLPQMIRKIDYGRADNFGYKIKTIKGLKPLTTETLWSLELT